jgi:hypothetical protein
LRIGLRLPASSIAASPSHSETALGKAKSRGSQTDERPSWSEPWCGRSTATGGDAPSTRPLASPTHTPIASCASARPGSDASIPSIVTHGPGA